MHSRAQASRRASAKSWIPRVASSTSIKASANTFLRGASRVCTSITFALPLTPFAAAQHFARALVTFEKVAASWGSCFPGIAAGGKDGSQGLPLGLDGRPPF